MDEAPDQPDAQPTSVRTPVPQDVSPLVQLWRDGWHDAHADLVTPEILLYRTLETFKPRLVAMLPDLRVTGAPGAPTGMCVIKDGELDQLFVAAAQRSTGTAVSLLKDAEARLHDRGTGIAWLSCTVGNERAARFYEKHGWTSDRFPVVEELNAAPGLVVEVWRYAKTLL